MTESEIIHPPIQESKSLRSRLSKLFLPLALLGLKFGKIALLVLKGSKFLTTSLTMIISIGAYALLFGLPFAAGFVILLFIHEMGHAIQLKREGIKASAPIFIPFLGAAIAMKEMPHNAGMEARVGLAGPIMGTIGVLFTWAWALQLSPGHWQQLLLALAYTGAFLNLFNLLPISPLDGGRAMAAISPMGWLLGILGGIAALFILGPNPILILILLIGGLETVSRFRRREIDQEYYQTSARVRKQVAGTYIVLVLGLVLIMQQTFIQL